MPENRATKSVTTVGQRRYNVVLTGNVRKGFDPEQVAVELAQLAKIDAAQATALLGGAARVVKSNVDQSTATLFQTRFEGIGADCIIKEVSHAPVDRVATAAEPSAKTLTTLSIKDAFEGELEPAADAEKFPTGLLPVALFTLLLPLLYVALVGVLAYHTAWHVLNNYDWLLEKPYALNIAWYIVPSLLGTLLLLALFKPLLMPGVKTQLPLKLEKREDSLFFSFVDQVAQRSGLPMPTEIDVDCAARVSAQASTSGQVTLTIGLPLVGGLSARQLSAVIALALGRYTSRRGNFLWRTVRGIHASWYRCVFEHDVLDFQREKFIERYPDYRGWLLSLSKGFDWVTRKLMLMFFKLGRRVSRGALRKMELDTDRLATRFCGSIIFGETLQRLHELDVAEAASDSRLSALFDEGKLSDHLPRSIVELSCKLPERYREAMSEALDLPQKARVCSDRERIEHAEHRAAHAIFVSDAPATALLVRYERLSRQATLVYYRHRFGVTLKSEQLVGAIEKTVAQAKPADVSDEHLKSYMGGQFEVTRFLNVRRQAAFAAPDPAETKRRLDHVVQQVRQNIKAYEQSLAKYRAAYAKQIGAIAARTLAENSVAFDAAAFQVDGTALSDTNRSLQVEAEKLNSLQPELAKFESLIAQRFELALSMRPDGKTQDEIHRLQGALSVVTQMHDGVTALRGVALALQHVARDSMPVDGAHIAIECRNQYDKLLVITGTAAYPFEGNANEAFKSIADYLRSYCGSAEQFEDEVLLLQTRVANIRKCAEFLHERTVVHLAAIAADVEDKLGVDSIKQVRAVKQAEDDVPLPF